MKLSSNCIAKIVFLYSFNLKKFERVLNRFLKTEMLEWGSKLLKKTRDDNCKLANTRKSSTTLPRPKNNGVNLLKFDVIKFLKRQLGNLWRNEWQKWIDCAFKAF